MIQGQFCLYSSKPDADGWAASGGVGIVEAPAGILETERVLAFTAASLGQNLVMSLGDYCGSKVGNHGREMHHYVIEDIWPRPVNGAGVIGGGLLLRHTRLPASPGHEMLVASMCVHAPEGAVASQRLYSLSGTTRMERKPDMLMLHDPQACDLLAENGIGMARLLKRPAWGWSGEKFAMQSTMHLDTIDQCREIGMLRDVAVRTPEQKSRLKALRQTSAWSVGNHGADDTRFQAFRRIIGSTHPHDDWTKPVTATQHLAHAERCEQAIRQVMQDGEPAYA